MNNCKLLQDSHAFDAIIDFILMAWAYVRTLPTYDDPQHNSIRKDCFKLLSLSARNALKQGGIGNIGSERISSFRSKFKSMVNDFEDMDKICKELLFPIIVS